MRLFLKASYAFPNKNSIPSSKFNASFRQKVHALFAKFVSAPFKISKRFLKNTKRYGLENTSGCVLLIT